MPGPQPYRTSPVFTETTLPLGFRRQHRTKAGVWGLIRVLEGRLRLLVEDGGTIQLLTPDAPGLVCPDQPHRVEPVGRMRMVVEFYDRPPG